MFRNFNSLVILILILYCSPAVLGQKAVTSLTKEGFSITREISGLQKNVSGYGRSSTFDYFTYTDNSAAGTLKLPSEELYIAIPAGTKPEISFVVLEDSTFPNAFPAVQPRNVMNAKGALVQEAVDAADVTGLQNPVFQVAGYFWFRDFYCARVKVPLAVYNYAGQSITEIQKYEIRVSVPGIAPGREIASKSKFDDILKSSIVNASIAEQFRSTPPVVTNDPANDWIDYNGNYLKIGVYEDKIYRLTAAAFSNAGITDVINPATIKMYNRGVEQKILVQAGDDGVFDPADYIEFYGTKNYNPGSVRAINPDTVQYTELLNRYSDTSFYFITWGGVNAAQRTGVVSGRPDGVTDTLKYYTDLIHIETDSLYQGMNVQLELLQDAELQSFKSWFGADLLVGELKTKVTLSDIVPGKTAGLYCKLVSGASSRVENAHSLALGFKSSAVVSDTNILAVQRRSAYRNERILIGGNLPSDSLKNGVNTIVLRNYANGTTTNALKVDWYEVEAPRLLHAKNDAFSFEVREAENTGVKVVKINKLTPGKPVSDYILYRIKPNFTKITDFKKTDSTLYFADTLAPGNAYVLLLAADVQSVPIVKKKTFINLRAARRADYIGITHPTLLNSAKTYCTFIKNQYSVESVVVLIDDIYDEFAYGYPEPESVKGFLKAAYSNWTVPRPSVVTFLGGSCYDYKQNFLHRNRWALNENLVPSFGEPVSDTWFTIWDDNAPLVAQMLVGRIPAKKPADLDFYLQKHQKYVTDAYTVWNKRGLFFSGGESENAGEILLMKIINNAVVELAKGNPFGMDTRHFYKTLNPQTNFGPYTPNAVMNEIAQGGVFISYIGHSGTATWDNNLTNPDQLLNNSNRGSMVTDFGCSTNKFAEPDIECFGARFVNNGQAIAYVGNATLGFSSTTSLMSELFYKYFFEDSVSNIAQAHRLSKNHMLTQAGTTRAYRYFALSNTLIGDPMVNLALPRKVNLTVNNEEYFSLEKTDPSEEDSLAVVTIRYDNIGSVTTDTVTINVTVMHNNVNTVQKMFRRAIPKNSDTLMVALPVRRLIGTHLVTVEIDPESALDEYSRSDNKYTYSINVLASALRGIVKSDFSSEIDPVINVLNPILEPANKSREAIMQYDTTESFTTAQVKTIPIDTFVTKVPLNTLTADKDYYLRFRLNSTDTSWSGSSTIRKGLKNSPFLVEGKKSLTKQKLVNSYFDGQGIKIKNDTLHFVVNSCGINFKAFGSMTLNDSVLVQGIGTGMNIVIVDSATLQVETAEFFNYGNIAYRFDSLVALINRTPFGKIVFMGIVSDGITSTNLFDNPILKDAIISLGAKLIEQLGYQYPWVLMGKKGLAKGQAKEDLKTRAYLDTLQLDTTLYRINKTGYFTTLPVKTAGKWKQLTIDYTVTGDGTVKVRPIVLRANGITDTLQYLNIAANTADLSVLDTVNAQSVRFEVSLGLSSSGISPVLKSLAADFDGLPELGFNYETVRLSRQEMKLGKTDSLFITVLNGGYFKASSVNLLVELQDGSKRDTIDQRVIPQVNPGDKFYINLPYNPGTGEKNRNFIVTIDPEKKIPDYVSDNNTFRLPFTVSVDSTLKPYITAYADSSALIDGDFIPAKPTLHFELFDPTIDPITDSTFILSIYDNDNRVFIKNNPAVSIVTSTSNPKLKLDYKPALSTGEHFFEIKALSGSRRDTVTFKVTFIVNDELQILQLYNYPNPFKDKTNFAFQLSKVPETFYIKIYTVAGRLIKTIETTAGALKVGYNKSLVWDGRDADGNNVASGVYLAKVIAKLQGKTFTSTMKLAVVR